MRNPEKGNGSEKPADLPPDAPRTVEEVVEQTTKLGDHKPGSNGSEKK